jgi:hypothetical protein
MYVVEEKEGSFFYQQYIVEWKEGSFFYQQYIVEWKEEKMIPPSPQQCTVDRKNDPSFHSTMYC